MEAEDRVRLFGTDVLKGELAANDLQSFQQEYECVFIDSAESFIAMDLILDNTPGRRDEDWQKMGATDEGEIDIEVRVFHTADTLCEGYIPEKHGRLFLGYDVARRRGYNPLHRLWLQSPLSLCLR